MPHNAMPPYAYPGFHSNHHFSSYKQHPIIDQNGQIFPPNLTEQKKKRNRKNPNQMTYLMQEYAKDPNWSKETCQRVSKATGLTESQVYKWGWDQKNKKCEEGQTVQ